jgi:hypothetical protein
MNHRQIAGRISLLEQTVLSRAKIFKHAQREANGEQIRERTRASAASRGCCQEANESSAELFARSLGMSCRDLTTALEARAAGPQL